MEDVKNLKINLFASDADLEVITHLARNPLIKGFAIEIFQLKT